LQHFKKISKKISKFIKQNHNQNEKENHQKTSYFNIKPGHQLQAYELIEQKCIDEYVANMDAEIDLYDSICHE